MTEKIKLHAKMSFALWFVSTIGLATPAIEFINHSSDTVFMKCGSSPENIIPVLPLSNKQYSHYSSFWIASGQYSLAVVCSFSHRSPSPFATATIQLNADFQTAYVSSNDFTSAELISPASATSSQNATQNMTVTFS